MADGPTVQEIIKTRETNIAGCEATARSEGTALKLTALSFTDSLKNLLKLGPFWEYKRTLDIASKEHLCKYTATLTADKDFAIREAELEARIRSK